MELLVTNMAISNQEKQKRYRDSKIEAGESRLSLWLPKDDNDRLLRLMESLDSTGEKKQSGYIEVISQALKELEISLTPAPQREIVRYGLRNMETRGD